MSDDVLVAVFSADDGGTPLAINALVEDGERIWCGTSNGLFVLDRAGPHLLREGTAADGSHLKMKRNLKVDYWNYSKPGDRERALNNPMLRLPD